MIIERNAVSGAYVISESVGSQLETRRYYGYTRQDAIRLFRAEMRRLKSESRK